METQIKYGVNNPRTVISVELLINMNVVINVVRIEMDDKGQLLKLNNNHVYERLATRLMIKILEISGILKMANAIITYKTLQTFPKTGGEGAQPGLIHVL